MGEPTGRKVRGRFAPSPSGRMHLGNVCCAMLAYLAARSQGGELVLRIEDLDTSRCHPPYDRWIMEDMQWLGLEWDEGPDKGGPHEPYEQSQCGEIYAAALAKLSEKGLVYPCFCSRADLLAAQAPHASDGMTRYSGACRCLSEEDIKERTKRKKPALRVRVGNANYCFNDGFQGIQSSDLEAESGDFVLRRADGIAAYQLAVVVDDARMGITQVVRGRDLLSSTARQLYLYDLLGLEAPEFYHMPLLVAPDGRRLSKREKDLDMGALREKYKSPEPLLGKMAYLCGILDRAEPIDMKSLVRIFDFNRVHTDDLVVDPDKF